MSTIAGTLGGSSLFARLARSVGWTALGFVALQALRLASNLILTRLLFPEAFGLMALVSVFVIGLTMFSDIGLGPSIMQHKRGDEPDFLNTAWTIQVVRGICLWLAACALAWPAAAFYAEPVLAQMLPVAGLSLLVAGFNPTRLQTANRHLTLGRVTVLELISQAIGILAMIALAWATQSVWALVVGGVVGAVAKLGLAHVLLPGTANRFVWEPSAAADLIRFGKWLFLSTALAFVIAQGDKAILGKYLPLDMLGIYNIGYFLASFPLLLGGAVISRILIPLYRERPPAASAENFQKIRWMRFVLTGGILSLVLLLAYTGIVLVGALYDPRYSAAGAIVVVIACTQILQVIGLTYDQAALAAGDSRNFFLLFAVRAVVHVTLFVVGVETAGLLGALAGQGLAMFLVHPLIIWLARRHGAWDPLHDAAFALVGIGLGGLALWLNQDAVAALAAFGAP